MISMLVRLMVFAAVLAVAPRAMAQPSLLETDELRARFDGVSQAAKVPQGELRALLALWDFADPKEVEGALLRASREIKSKPAAVYAQTLLAEARGKRGDLAGQAELLRRLGYLSEWQFIGPFDDENRVGFASAYQPEMHLTDPIVPGRAFEGKSRPVRFRSASARILNFGDWLRPQTAICGYATTLVKGEASPRNVTLWVGVEGSFRLWWGKDLVLEDAASRGFDFDRMAETVVLAPGWNRLTVKVCSDRSAPKVAIRIGDAQGGALPTLVVSAEPQHFASTTATPSKKPSQNVKGPVQEFEAMTAAKGSAGAAESYARYLVATGGDPRGEHRARDLAAQAFEAGPTWERGLLAADLAEDRNQAQAFVDRAKTLARGDRRGEVQTLLATARLRLSSQNRLDAIAVFDDVLSKDPANVVATAGKTQLMLDAGLPRTAVALLEDAVRVHPSSVALLRLYGSLLRGAGREAEADQVDARWFALQMTDTSYIARQIERATMRGDREAALGWLLRLETYETDKVFQKQIAARTLRALGEPKRARASLEAALELAPEEPSTLRALSDLAGAEGDRDEQLRYLRKIRELSPQDKEVRAYIEYLSPQKAKRDELYAWSKERIEAAVKTPAHEPGPMRVFHKLAVTTVYENGLASRFYQLVFSPQTEAAAAEARQFVTQYEGGRQEIEVRLSRVYRKDGSVAEAIESGEGAANDPTIAMYTSMRTYAVSFPRLSPGDVVELRYRIDDVAIKNDVADSFYDVEFLQGPDPIDESEFVLITPLGRSFGTKVANLAGVESSTTDQDGQRITRFLAKSVPSTPREPGAPPFAETVGQLHISSFRTWDEVATWYYALAKEQLDVDDEVRAKLREITKTAMTEREKVEAVYHFATGLQYVALEFGLEGIKPRRCALTMARGWGDCKDKASVIVTMLRELGISSTLVLVRTRQRGDLPADVPPSLGVFDHAIAYVPSLDLYLDGTADGSGTRELPAMDRDAVGLQINEGRAKLVRLPNPPAEDSPHRRTVALQLRADGSAEFTFASEVGGVNAPAWRSRYWPEPTRRERAAQDLSNFFGTVELPREGAVVVPSFGVEGPFSLSVRGRAGAFARKEGKSLTMKVAASLSLMSTVASLSSRTTDVVLGARSSSDEQRTVQLPPGAHIVRRPEDVKLDSPFGSVSLSTQEDRGAVTIKSHLHLTTSRVKPADYPAFRAFCQAADRALDQRLVVEVGS